MILVIQWENSPAVCTVVVLSIHLIVWMLGVRWGIVALADGCHELLIPVTAPHYEAVGGSSSPQEVIECPDLNMYFTQGSIYLID